MAVKSEIFEIFANGFDDIIDITPVVLNFTNGIKDGIIAIYSKEKNTSVIQFNPNEIKDFTASLNSIIDNFSNMDINHLKDCVNFKNILKSLVLGKNRLIDIENLTQKNEKILFMDFTNRAAKKQITIKIIY